MATGIPLLAGLLEAAKVKDASAALELLSKAGVESLDDFPSQKSGAPGLPQRLRPHAGKRLEDRRHDHGGPRRQNQGVITYPAETPRSIHRPCKVSVGV